ncbi:DNA ligase [Psychromonas hadalis]|uniref:DNA ligase n=1 Tax=Psychromonas hadalis TaxID=211669 RepID=UPI0003B6EF73|nr:DNA ligase [Psychromonas hadalis]
MPLILLFLLLFSPLLQAAPPPIQLATKFHEDIIINHYWVSEKLDGVRGYWDGKQLLSRQGNYFPAPTWFTADFPNVPLDGELWIKRGQFEQVSGIVRSHKGDPQAWQAITFRVFDLPSSLATFTQRLTVIKQLVDSSASPYLKMIPQQKISTHQALQSKLDEVIAAGGEGLMLHHINAYYQVKRSADLMKLKRHEDAEAIILGHIAGKGKHTGRMGALLVKTLDGITFKIGTGFTDNERENPPQIGDIITFKYIGKTKNNVPRFASYLRIRVKASP